MKGQKDGQKRKGPKNLKFTRPFSQFIGLQKYKKTLNWLT